MEAQQHEFNGATKTVGGYEAKGVEYNSIPGRYIGMAFDLNYMGGKFRTFSWSKTGKAPKGWEKFNLVKP